jgi:hypothetical protein
MKNQELEKYFKTENEHWNTYALKTIRKALEKQLFSDFNKLMYLYELSIDISSNSHREKPFEGLQFIISEYDKNELSIEQKIYLLEGVFEFLDCTEFDGWYSTEIQDLINSQIIFYKNEKNKIELNPDKPLTVDIRNNLKKILEQELLKLPNKLDKMDDIQRVNVLCKLIPYILPKTESVVYSMGEPEKPKRNWYD